MELRLYILLLSFLVIIFLIFSFTAFFYFFLEIEKKDIICIHFFHPQRVYENEIFEFLVRCENCGSVSSEYYVEILIYNNNFFRRALSVPQKINPSQFIEYSVNFSLPRGFYNISVRCFSSETYKEGISNIEVIPRPIQIVPSTPSAPLMIPKKYEIEVIYPKVINISQGDTISFFIKIINKGDTISNLKLNFSSELNFKLRYPLLISKLMYNETAIFFVELNVSYYIEPKNYISTFCVISNEIEKCFEIEVNVTKSELLERIEKLIDFYEKLIKDLNIEITNLEIHGKNVEFAKKYLHNASSHLLYSKNFFRFKLLEESLKELENVRKFLSLVIIEISKLYLETFQKAEERVYYAVPIHLILYFLISILIIFLLFFLIRKIREYLKYRSLYSFKLRRLKLRSF